MRRVLSLLPLALAAGCMPSIHVEVLKPADITLPPDVQTVAVLDRSAPKNTGQAVLGTLEGALTGEGIMEDRDGASQAVTAVVDVLRDSPRFDVVIPNVDDQTAQSNLWDTELSWPVARRVANRSGAQAIVSLEAFDSDSSTETRVEVVEREDHRETRHVAERETRVLAAWRLYYLGENPVILDDIRDHSSEDTWEHTADSRDEALRELPSRRRTVMDLGYLSGEWYGMRIAPTFVLVGRSYYAKGHPALKNAKAHVKARDWEGAVKLWRRIKDLDDPKVKGRAQYNLALAREVNGDLEGALDLARRASRNLQNHRAARYVDTLERRLREQRVVEEQMAPVGGTDEPAPPVLP